MVKEIYIRTEDDPMFIPGIIDYSNEIESIITKVKMLLGTVPGEVLGDSDFGIDIEYLVFDTKQSALDIKEKLNELLLTYIPTSKNVTLNLDINFGKTANGNDFGIVDVYINEHKAIGFLVNKDDM
jgi:hypothetical protein